ncbi:hypothetical protein EYF80_021638 [Liparis tanakae]|uniref:Uncharacterized protein n=1 Tax=Liparis tanakae TaxID=230148 RepID=A0A4Z2HS88_9TELE|nr:hypothetical protein EYF80_021638 [Liparis tanakae]
MFDAYLTTSTAPARTFGSLPIIDTLAANDPSILKTTNSVPRGTMERGPYMKRPVTIWAPSSVNTASFTRWFAVTF